jgi:hypothetical protein
MDVGLLPLCWVRFYDEGKRIPLKRDDDSAPQKLPSVYNKGISIDIGIAGVLALLCLILVSVGWKNLISVTYQGARGNAIADICGIICVTFLIAWILRIVVGFLHLFVPKYRAISLMLRRRFFRLIVVLSGITFLPILSMILRSTDAQRRACEWFGFMSNTDNFLEYFMLRNATCLSCARVHVQPLGCAAGV